jgi:hypothetical protein
MVYRKQDIYMVSHLYVYEYERVNYYENLKLFDKLDKPRGGDQNDTKSNHSTKSTETADSPVIVEDSQKQGYPTLQQQLSYPPNVMLSPKSYFTNAAYNNFIFSFSGFW